MRARNVVLAEDVLLCRCEVICQYDQELCRVRAGAEEAAAKR